MRCLWRLAEGYMISDILRILVYKTLLLCTNGLRAGRLRLPTTKVARYSVLIFVFVLAIALSSFRSVSFRYR